MISYAGEIKPHESVVVTNLPVGAYVGKVVSAEIETINGQNGSFERLVLKLDVTEGEHKDHYTNLYESQKGGAYPARYRGVIRFTIPQKGSQYEAGQKKSLEHLAFCLEDSNPKYKWDGDESKMKGLAIGFSVRERDWIMEQNGALESGTTTEIGRVESVQRVKAGTVKPMKKKELRDADKAKLEAYRKLMEAANGEAPSVAYDEELPF